MASSLPPLPLQPDESEWQFVRDLQTIPYHQPVPWVPREPQAREAAFPVGLSLQVAFPDPGGVLTTAYADFAHFLQTVGLSGTGPYTLLVRPGDTSVREEYRLTVRRDCCELVAADTEGIRRGLIWLEDEMLRRGGPFLPLGTVTRTPLIRTRISRCFYGPINRPPKCKDELVDDENYYPDEYLNRLAHEGINVLWLTIKWYETIPSQLIPEYGRQAAPRLAKLRRTVAQCARYGIKVYPFCIEPAALSGAAPEVVAAAAAHPELKGHNGSFCTSTELGRAYVEEAVRTLFTEVPGLGGLIVIPVGERQTHCYSGAIPDGGMWPSPNHCPRCADRQPHEVLAEVLAAMRRGIEAVSPEAELVAWPYGQFISWGPEKTAAAAAHIPPGVILQHNFETGGRNFQLGKWRRTWDYWLSYAGPSDLFRQCATAAVKAGARASAKLQVGCSHEVATTQVVPAPGLLHRKYTAMHELGVSSAMHSWYFGSYPSLMTKAAGELSFAPFFRRAKRFLQTLARRDWGAHADQVVTAWQWFEKGYTNYPTAHIFGYFGPMHDGPAWPMYLIPRRLPLAPTWQLGYPPSGDYIAECVVNGFTLAEIVTLCRRMSEYWWRGVELLQQLRPAFADQPERLADIGLATALGLQFRSGYHLVQFYALREQLAEARRPAKKLRLLARLRELVEAELQVSGELLPLAEADSRLGFHSEAEGYKYFPALLRWRRQQLQWLLAEEFPAVESQAQIDGPLFPDYTGEQPTGPVYDCPQVAAPPAAADWAAAPATPCEHWLRQVFNPDRQRRCAYDPMDSLPVPEADRQGRRTTWQALHTPEALYLRIVCHPAAGQPATAEAFAGDGLQVFLEPCRTQPRRILHLGPDGAARCQQDDGYLPAEDNNWTVVSELKEEGWTVVVRLPWDWLGLPPRGRSRRLRVNVVRSLPLPEAPGSGSVSWAERQPCRGRLVWGTLNPATDFGWLRLRGK